MQITTAFLFVLDTTGREVVHYFYDAWGKCKTTILDEAHAAIARLNPFRYRGYYYDTETNLYYLNTRYYDPETGRFISADDTKFLNPDAVNGLNLFAYCANNPVMNVDPSGRFFFGLFIASIIVGATIGFVSGGLKAVKNGQSFWKGALLGALGGALIGAALGTVAGWIVPAAGAFVGAGAVSVGSGAAAIATVGVEVAVAAVAGVTVAVVFAKWTRGSWPGDDPTKSPGDGFIWRGPGEVGSEFGEWYNPTTFDQLHPDLKHLLPKGPHWGWRNKLKRIFIDIFKDGI